MSDQDYSKLNREVNSLFAGKARPRSSGQPNRVTIQIEVSEMPKKIPPGSMVEIEKVPAKDLKFGDIVYVGGKDRAVLGRFVGLKGDMLEITQSGTSSSQHPAAKLLGKVVRVSDGNKSKDFTSDLTMSRAVLRVQRFLGGGDK